MRLTNRDALELADHVSKGVKVTISKGKQEARPEARMSRGDASEPDPAELARRVIESAVDKKIGLVTAESCTAGAVACALSDVPGAGDVLHGGFVVYSKDAKIRSLGVPSDIIARHTAVSAETARAMALAALGRSPAELAVAVTGCLGPKPDEDGNPAGLVFVAVCRKGRPPVATRIDVSAEKEQVRLEAVRTALVLFARLLEEE